MKTYNLKASDISKKWVLIDAKEMVLGRLAVEIAKILRGKHRPDYTPHVDCGDNVIVINAEKVHLTGKKRENKIYYKHTGHPGGIKSTNPAKILDGKHPERVIVKAVERMLPNGPLARQQMKNLRVYAGEKHDHDAQNPKMIDLASKNPKNIARG